MKVWGALENAQLENKSSNYTAGVVGRIWWRTDLTKAELDDGTNIRALLRNDGFCVFGNNATAANNVRFHRGASTLFQLVDGSDTTAEGTLSTSLAKISARLESYTDAAKPAFGNSGRLIYITDLAQVDIDTGAAWSSIAIGARANTMWTWVIGSVAQVAAGTATHSTWAGAISAASAGDTIRVLIGAWTENVTIAKELYIEGSGYGSNLTGSITFQTSSDRSFIGGVRMSDNLTINSGVTLVEANKIWFASGKSFLDNSGTVANDLSGFQET